MLSQFFKESNGQLSMTRLMMFITTLFAMLLCIYIYYKSKNVQDVITAWIGIVGMSYTAKVIQKSQETNTNNESQSG